MANKDIELKIAASVESAEAAKTLGQLRKSLQELESLASEADLGSENFKTLQTTISNTSLKMAETSDRLDAIREKVSTIKGEPIERLNSSIGLLRESVFTLNFDKAKRGIEGLTNAFLPLGPDGTAITGIKGISGAMNNLGGMITKVGTTFATMGKALLTNPIFLIGAAIALIVVSLVKLLDSLGLLTIVMDAIKKAIGFVIQAFKDLTDWIGITDHAGEKYAADELIRQEKLRKATQDQYDEKVRLFKLTEDLTRAEIELLSERLGVTIDAEKSIFELQRENNAARHDALISEEGDIKVKEKQTKEELERLLKIKDEYKAIEKERTQIKEQEEAYKLGFELNTESVINGIRLKSIKDDLERSKESIKIAQEEELRKIDIRIKTAEQLGLDTSSLEQAKLDIQKFYSNEEVRVVKEDGEKKYNAYKASIQKQLKSLEDNERAKIIITEENSEERVKAEIDSISKIEKYQIDNAKALGLSEAAITIIKAENVKKREDLETGYNQKVLDVANKQKVLLAEIGVLEATNEEERINAQIVLVQTQSEALLTNKKLTAEEIIKIEKDAANEIAALTNDLNKIKIDADALTLNTEVSNLEFGLDRFRGSLKEREALIRGLLKTRLDALEADRIQELSNVNLTSEQRAAIEEKYRQARIAAEENANQNIFEGLTNTINKISEYTNMVSGVLNDVVSMIADANKQRFEEELAGIQNQADSEKRILDNKYKNGLISKAQYEESLDKLDKKSRQKELAAKKKAFEDEKKTKIAATTISGLQGAVSAFAGAMQLGPIAGPIVGGLLAAATLAMSAANVSKIQKQKFDSGGASGGDTPNIGNISIPTSGSENSNASLNPAQFFGLGQSQQGTGSVPSGPQRVYVVESDITSTQNTVQVIEDRAVF